MINISESAQSHFVKLLSQQGEGTSIRIFVVNPGTTSAECGVSYCPPDAVESTDVVLEFNGFGIDLWENCLISLFWKWMCNL